MEELLKKIDECNDKSAKYDLTIEYMENSGIVFTTAQRDHINLKYRILTNGSSIFVYVDHFKMNLCDTDKEKVEKSLGITFTTNYKDKGRGVIDKVRPWTCEFSGASMLEKVVEVITDKAKNHGINYPMKPLKVHEGMVHCPHCEYVFEKANRCPECGQLIDYEEQHENVLNNIDVNNLYLKLCECKTKKQLVETWNEYGLKTTTKPIDNVTIDDKYLQLLDGSRIQFSTDSLKLWTSTEIAKDAYFEKVRELISPVKDGSYRVNRITLKKSITNFSYILEYFIYKGMA